MSSVSDPADNPTHNPLAPESAAARRWRRPRPSRCTAEAVRASTAALLVTLLVACATTQTPVRTAVEPPFPSPLAGPGGPEIERHDRKQVGQGWQALQRSDLVAAAAAAAASGGAPQGLLLGLQVELLEPGHRTAARIASLTDQHRLWAAAWLTLSVAAEREGDERTAVDAAIRGAELWDNARWRGRVDELHTRWVTDRLEGAAKLFADGELDEALNVLSDALALEPRDRGGRLLEIRILVELGRYEDADQALAAFAADPEALVLAARLAERREDWPRAMELYSSLPEDDPDRAGSLRRAQIRWRLSVLPGYVREALVSPALTRAELAVILVALAPEVEAVEGGTVPLLSDIVDLPSQREVLAVVRADLMSVDPLEREFHPRRQVTVPEVIDAVDALCHLLGYRAPQWCEDGSELIISECTAITAPVSGEFLAELVLGLTEGTEP